MALPIRKIKGMTSETAAKFEKHGISNADEFLKATRTPKEREELAKKLNVDHKAVLEFANRADLARVKGIGGVFSNLLEEAGVDTVKELSHRVPENLHAKIAEVNSDKKLAGRTPTQDAVAKWVAEAKTLPAALDY